MKKLEDRIREVEAKKADAEAHPVLAFALEKNDVGWSLVTYEVRGSSAKVIERTTPNLRQVALQQLRAAGLKVQQS